jgi:Zn-dependent M28 family amino/carboxypeptidase
MDNNMIINQNRIKSFSFKHLVLIISLLLSINGMAQRNVDTTLIIQHLERIIGTDSSRMHENIEILDQVAEYIFTEFDKYADTTYFQSYSIDGKEYKNVVCVFEGTLPETIVVGAHYDVCGPQDGADDNASGVVGLLELVRMLEGQTLNNRLEIVAYTLEEPPYFRTEYMGSAVHAKSLVERDINVTGMFCLEMIGYFDEAKKSQDYPMGILKLIYGRTGDYITLVNKFGKGKFARQFTRRFDRKRLIKTKRFKGPKSLPGVDFSDHLNYWNHGVSALMITDTAFYRNKNYHKKTDTIETLDIQKMALVIQTVYQTIIQF